MSLSNKQRAFVLQYLIDYNGAQAAIRAGYSSVSSRSTASALLTNPNIQALIKEKEMSADEVKSRLADIARGNLADLMDITTAGFTFKLLIDKDGEKAVNPKTKLIKKIKQRVTTILAKKEDGEDREIIETEIELYSALDALQLIGKYHKLFVDRTELTGKDGKPVQFAQVEEIIRQVYGQPENQPGD